VRAVGDRRRGGDRARRRPDLFEDYVQGSDHGTRSAAALAWDSASAKRMAGLMGGAVGLEANWAATAAPSGLKLHAAGSQSWLTSRGRPSPMQTLYHL